METIKVSEYKIGLLCIKYIPVLIFLIMWIHTGLLCLDINIPIADTIAGSAIFPSILILSVSKMLKFCWLHKSLTVYSLVVDLCINYQRYIGFGSFLFFHKLMYFSIGCILFTWLVYSFFNYIKNCVNLKRFVYYVRSYQESLA